MKKYNFDKFIDRHNTSCMKFDGIQDQLPPDVDVMPMWIADMDMPTPDFVLDAVRERLEHPVIGYSFPSKEYKEAIMNWMEKRYNMVVSEDEFCYTPGIVSGIYKVLQCITEKGDGVVICPPVYPPFAQVVRTSERKLLEAQLIEEDSRFYIDFDLLEEKIKEAKALIWCHPHNPGGRVWHEDEMIKVVNMCHKYGVYIISDEIHADHTFPPAKHTPMASVSPEAALWTITFMAPSKAFNMPGIVGSQLIINQPDLREKVFTYLENNGLNMGNACAYPAITAAYTKGEEWLEKVVEYIVGNVNFVEDYLNKHLPEVRMMRPEASFLIFLNFDELGLTDEQLHEFLITKAGLFLNPGTSFGSGGEGWMRLNIGLPREQLKKAMLRLTKAVDLLLEQKREATK